MRTILQDEMLIYHTGCIKKIQLVVYYFIISFQMCTCTNDVIDCSGRGLKDLPEIDSSLQPAQKILDISVSSLRTPDLLSSSL